MDVTDIRAKHQGDPAAFMTAMDAYQQSFLAANPNKVGTSVGQYAAGIAAQHRDDMVNTNVRLDTETNIAAQHDRLKLIEDGMDGLAAKAGGVTTPQYDAWQDERQDLQDKLVANPLAKYNEAFRNTDDQIFNRRVSLSGYIGAARDRFQASGNLSEATQWFEKAVSGLGLSEKEQLSAEGEIRSHLWGVDALRRQENEDVKNRADGLIYQSKATGRVDPAQLEATARDLDERRLYGKGAEVRAQARFQDAMPALAGRTGADAVAALQGVRTYVDRNLGSRSQAVNTSIPPEGRALLDTIAGPEAGGNYRARYPGSTFDNGFVDHPRVRSVIQSGPDAGKTSDAAGRYEFLSSTWDRQAAKLGLRDFSPANQDAGAWDLAQTTYGKTTGRDLLSDLRSGNQGLIAGAASVLRGQWSSLPGGRQPGTTSDRFVSQYSSNLGRYGAASTANTFAIGDSLADGARAAGGIQGVTRVGAQPGEILASIQGMAPAQLSGKTILLSGGSSNDPVHGPDLVAQQVAALKAKGVDPSNIRIVGVGDRDDFQTNGVNPKLQAVARQTGAQFVPLDPRTLASDRVHLANYGDLAGSKGQAASIASGTAEAAPAFRTLLKDTQDTFNDHADRTWKGVKYALDKGYAPTPQETADLKAMAPFVTKPELLAEMQEGLTKLQTNTVVKGMTLAQQQELAATMQVLATGGQLGNVERHLAANLQGEVEYRVTLAKDQPVLYAQRHISPGPLAPLDLSSPQALAVGLQARQKLKGAAQQADAMVGSNVLTPSDRDQITATLEHGNPQQAATLLSGLGANLKPEEMAAALGEKGGLKDSVIGMARSLDPAKMNAALGFLDAQERANPRLFAAQFGEVSPDLTRWQNLLRWMPSDEVPKAMQKYNDPTRRAALKASDEAASDLLKNVTPAQVTAKFNTWNGFFFGGNPLPPAAKFTGGASDMFRLIGADRPLSRRQSEGALEDALGPTWNRLEMIRRGIGDAAGARWDATDTHNVRFFLLQNLFAIRKLLDQAEDGVNNAFGIKPRDRSGTQWVQ